MIPLHRDPDKHPKSRVCTGPTRFHPQKLPPAAIALAISRETILMGSDTSEAHGPVTVGDNFSISVDTTSQEEAERFFNGLSAGGRITMPLNKTFWGAFFGMLVDKFGIHWLINYDTNS